MIDTATPQLDAPAKPRPWTVFSSTSFRKLWVASTLSLFGDFFSYIAMAWLVLQLTGSGLALGIGAGRPGPAKGRPHGRRGRACRPDLAAADHAGIDGPARRHRGATCRPRPHGSSPDVGGVRDRGRVRGRGRLLHARTLIDPAQGRKRRRARARERAHERHRASLGQLWVRSWAASSWPPSESDGPSRRTPLAS